MADISPKSTACSLSAMRCTGVRLRRRASASMAQFDDAAENVVVVDSISKRFSACGARWASWCPEPGTDGPGLKICQDACARPRWTSWALPPCTA